MPSQDLRLFSPSAHQPISPAALRNRTPIFDLLRDVFPTCGTVLEITSGSGEHIIHFATLLPGLVWQPSDPSPDACASIQEWVRTKAITNVLRPLDIDTSSDAWPIERADAMIAINMVHISPWAATLGLLKGAGKLLPNGECSSSTAHIGGKGGHLSQAIWISMQTCAPEIPPGVSASWKMW